MPSCTCNRRNAVCKWCTCAHAKKPCSSCLLIKMKKCVNTLSSHVDSVNESSRNNNGVHVSSDGLTIDHAGDVSAMDHMSCAAELRYNLHANTSACINHDVLCADDSQDVPVVGEEPSSQLN